MKACEPAGGSRGRQPALLLEARGRLVEAVLRGTIDAERARAILAGLAARADALAVGGRPPPFDPALQ